MTTPSDIQPADDADREAAIRARRAAIGAGDWELHWDGDCEIIDDCSPEEMWPAEIVDHYHATIIELGPDVDDYVAEFAAHAPDDIKYLLTALDAANERIVALTTTLNAREIQQTMYCVRPECSAPGEVMADGQWWCKRHAPAHAKGWENVAELRAEVAQQQTRIAALEIANAKLAKWRKVLPLHAAAPNGAADE